MGGAGAEREVQESGRDGDEVKKGKGESDLKSKPWSGMADA